MELTRDKQCALIRKWHTLIEAYSDVKTTDGYTVRIFVMGFTKKRPDQVKTNCYAQSAQIRRIRTKMVEIIQAEASKGQLRDLVKKLVADSVGKEIEKPKFDITKLMEMHADGGDDEGAALGRPENEEAQNTLTADIAAAADEDNE